ncbi:MAG: ABC transporter substrate-binding protein [Rickettsiaceae bacterium]|nr:ABC transporter substrate-binding protein [Rickettsiaceae bacterium]
MARFILIVFTVFTVFIPRINAIQNNPDQSEEVTQLRFYIQNLVDQGYDLLNNPSLPNKAKRKEIRKLISRNLYLDWMARYTLGRHRRVMSEADIEEFVNIYSQFVVKAYTDLFEYYNGHRALIKNIQQIDEDSFITQMEIVKADSQSPIEVSYLIHRITVAGQKDQYKIADIITEGISILNSQQSEFNSVILNQGLDVLIEDLQAKINAEKASKAKKG